MNNFIGQWAFLANALIKFICGLIVVYLITAWRWGNAMNPFSRRYKWTYRKRVAVIIILLVWWLFSISLTLEGY